MTGPNKRTVLTKIANEARLRVLPLLRDDAGRMTLRDLLALAYSMGVVDAVTHRPTTPQEDA